MQEGGERTVNCSAEEVGSTVVRQQCEIDTLHWVTTFLIYVCSCIVL